VVVYITSHEASKIIEKELSSIPNNVKFIKIHHPGYHKKNFSINWFVFLCRLRMHKPKAVVVTDYYDNVFRQLLLKTFWVYTFHGPENRGYTHTHIRDYDLIIVPGQGELERLESVVGSLNNYAVTGYSKFDYFNYHEIKPPILFKDTKPVIMYNPHFEKTLSSFFGKGIELLKALSETNEYNVIFMPHPDLSRNYPELINSVWDIPGVTVIDRPKINLDYMACTDIYITDVSSAVYEWLYFNKPVLFFNTKRIDWKNSKIFPSWVCGRVIEDVHSMIEAVEYSCQNPGEFEHIRKKVFSDTFFNLNRNVSRIIAETIWDKLPNEA
jgi:hypothetical protein